MESNMQKQLRIKFGALKRIYKEYDGYKKEEDKQRKKIEFLEMANENESTVRKQKDVLQETLNMYPNVVQRLTEQLEVLESLLLEHGEDSDIKNLDMKVEAQDYINSVKEFLNQINSQATENANSNNNVTQNNVNNNANQNNQNDAVIAAVIDAMEVEDQQNQQNVQNQQQQQQQQQQ